MSWEGEAVKRKKDLTDRQKDHRLIGLLFVALTKESWEEGPSPSEAIAAAKDWYWNNYDESQVESASVGLAALSAVSRPTNEKKAKP